MLTTQTLRPMNRILLALGVAAALSACSSVGYRCPLDPNEKPESPTACAGMRDAMAGATRGTGGKASVLLDNQGRLVPPELLENRPAVPLAAKLPSSAEPHRDASGNPVFHQPRVFKAYAKAYIDDNGALHDGHNAWFSTPGRWAYGTVDRPGVAAADMMRPAHPNQLPHGKVVPQPAEGAGAKPTAQTQVLTPQERDRAALQDLSKAAATVQKKSAAAPQAAPGVTAPTVGLAQ